MLVHQDFSKFHPMKPKLIENVDRMLAEDIARLMAMITTEVLNTELQHPYVILRILHYDFTI